MTPFHTPRKLNSELKSPKKKRIEKKLKENPMDVNNYIIQPLYIQDRNDSSIYADTAAITAKWVPSDNMGGNGNIRPTFNISTGKFTFDEHEYGEEGYCGMYTAMSSAMLLYRLLCLYQAKVTSEGPDGYKCIWWITLKHKATNETITFGEWKGAAGIWTRHINIKELSEAYKNDLLELLNLLYSKICPHPYDGLVAGSVA